MTTPTAILGGVLAFVFGVLVGTTTTMSGFDRSVKRGMFEVGGTVYAACALKSNTLPKCETWEPKP